MDAVKKLAGAFIVGGIFGLMGQVIMVLIGGILGPGYGPELVVPLVLGVMGIIGGVLFACGLYQKIEKVGGFGAIMPFCGLAAAVAGAICGIRGSGAPLGKAIVNGLKPFVIFLFIVVIVSALIGAGVTLVV